jgi:Mg-chelatase subunit ChlD
MLLEPELLSSLQPDVSLVATLLSLSKVIPQKTKETARQVVQQVVKQTLQRLKLPTEQAIRGALSRRSRNRRPKLHEIDWGRTIRQNLKHYQPSHHTLVPEQLIGHGRRQQRLKDLILCVDQSGSMASSVVYASIFGAVLASLPALKIHFIAFDTQVTELTAHLHDPVDLLFGTQLGGGTDIHKALSYAQSLIARPSDTVLVLITDLYEGGHAQPLLQKIQQLQQNGVKILILLALNDEGSPAYDRQMAERIGQWGIPVLACTPDAFPSLLGQYLS